MGQQVGWAIDLVGMNEVKQRSSEQVICGPTMISIRKCNYAEQLKKLPWTRMKGKLEVELEMLV